MTEIELIPAATALLVRDGADGVETLMLRRNSKIAFGGMWVFPGGSVDPEDKRDTHEESARIAAVREIEEETQLQVDADHLVPWSYWEPPARPTQQGSGPIRRFATWFFACPAPAGDVTIDMGEIHEHRWLTPAAALDLRRQGEIEIVPPTWITLTQLSRHGSVEAAMTWARSAPTREFCTRPIGKDPMTLAWAGDEAYPGDGAGAAGDRNRLVMHESEWEYTTTLTD